VTPRGFRERLATFGLGLALVLGSVAPGSVSVSVAVAAPPAPADRSTRAPTIYHKNRSFRIPFNVDPSDRPRLSEVQLWVSEDSGFTWKLNGHANVDRPSFTFRSPRDGEYWFAVRTMDTTGKLYPSEDESVEPSMKVVVDTTPPSLLLEPDGRRGSRVAVRWEVRDEHLDLNTLVLEYQAEGAREWRQVPIRRKTLIGSETWEAGTAEPLKVRGSIADKAGNKAEETIAIAEGTPGNPGVTAGANDQGDFSPPPISQISSNTMFPPPEELPRGPADPEPFATRSAPSPAGANAPGVFDSDAFGGGAAASPAPQPGRGPSAGGGQTLLVPSPQFAMQYLVEDAGPNGPAMVELWVTQDGGRTWFRRGEDPDRASPFHVDLGGEGTFGLCLVARAASGLGDQPPAPGDPPQIWVEVDSTHPHVQLAPPQVGTGLNLGKVAILWRAFDPHLGPQPVTIAWRADQPGAPWHPIAERLENTGKYIWTVPPNIPARFHLRVDVVDTVGNRGTAETAEGNPVIVDRARPRSRIIGLDPSARSGRSASPVAGSGVVIPR
jgi:hypothetical protein